MKPPPFVYVAPTSLDEAVAALAEHGEDAKVLAGGQSLIPLLSLRLARPTALIDLNGVAELSSIAVNGMTAIGAMTRHRSGRAFGRRREAGSPARGRRSLHRPRRDPHAGHDRRQPGPRRSRRRAARGRARPRRDLRGDEHPWHPHDQRRRLLRRLLHDRARGRRDPHEGHVPERRSGHRCVGAGDGPPPRRLRDGRCRGIGRAGRRRAHRAHQRVRPAGQSGRGRGRDEDKERRSTKLPRSPRATSTRPPTSTPAPRTAARSRRSWSGEH